MIGIGIIGCGKIAQVRHIPEFASNPDCKILGYFDNNFERAEQMAAKYGGHAYRTLDELINDKEIDAVSVCVANSAHCEVTVKALKAGKNVLCEKPMATTIEECELMVKTCRERNLKLMIAQNQRLAPAHLKAKELIEQGCIGKVLTFHSSFGHSGPENWSIDPGSNTWFFDPKLAAMGVMADLGIHKTDLIQYIIGQKVQAVSARLVTLDKKSPDGNPIKVDDNAICIYEMNGGAIGTMTASWTYYGVEDNSTVIFGTEGILSIYEIGRAPLVLHKPGQEPVCFDVDQIQTNDNQTESGVMHAFIDCLKNDTKPLITGPSVLYAMRAVFAAIESSKSGKRIEI